MTTAAVADAAPMGQAALEERRWSRRIAADLVGFVDAIAVILGGLVPAIIYAIGGGLSVNWLMHLQVCLVTAGIVHFCLRNMNMYDTSRMHDFPVEPPKLATALSITFIAVFGVGIPFAPKNMHLWIWYAVWITLSFVLLANVRFAARHVLAKLTHAGLFDARIAVYGSGTIARRVQEHLQNPELRIHFAGLFDDRQDAKRNEATGLAPNGRLADLIQRAQSGQIDRIIIALPQAADQRTQQIARRLEQLPVSLHVVTHISSDLVEDGPAHRVSNLGPVGLLDVKEKPLLGWGRAVKAAEDKVLGTLIALLFAPLLVVIAALIKLDSRGPVFFRQRRRGVNGQVIEVVKFRTMHVLEDGANVPQATRNDPRVTRVGRVLRRLSLDELPQIINVLRGEMSLVGPRPHALTHDQEFAEILARYPNRQQVRPGMTGLAQIEGFRGEIETADQLAKRLEKDLEYVERWSLWLDLRILLQTPFSCLFAKQAY